jgi:S-formylglutathione hydrolase FrmB
MGNFKGNFYSTALKMTTQINVIFPERSNDVDPVIEGEPRVLLLLHGLSGNHDEWLRFSKIEYYAKKYNFVIILPEVQRSFYSNTSYGVNYFDYVADELLEICGKWFRINTERDNVFIAGESMGGYGAVRIGLSRPDKFAGIASLSGVLDYESFTAMIRENSWPDMKANEIDVLDDKDTPIELGVRLAHDKNRPKLIQLCGTEDFLYKGNQKFRKALDEAGYGHMYKEGPGDHEWPYWDKAIQYAFMYFLDLDMKSTPIY